MGRTQPRYRPRAKQRPKPPLTRHATAHERGGFVRRTSSPASVHSGATTHRRFRPQSVVVRAARPCLRSSTRCRHRGSVPGSPRHPTNVDRWGDRRRGGTPRPSLVSRVRPHRLLARLAVSRRREEYVRHRHRVCRKRLRIPMYITPISVCLLRVSGGACHHLGYRDRGRKTTQAGGAGGSNAAADDPFGN